MYFFSQFEVMYLLCLLFWKEIFRISHFAKERSRHQMPFDGNIIYDNSSELFLKINSPSYLGLMQLRLIFEFYCGRIFRCQHKKQQHRWWLCWEGRWAVLQKNQIKDLYLVLCPLPSIYHIKNCLFPVFNP